MTKQEMFDKVYIGLLNQKFERSMKNYGEMSTCAYRGDGGMKCAAGHLIPDEEYKSDMDVSPSTLTQLRSEGLLPKCFQSLSQDDFIFVQKLQNVHDSSYTPSAMKHAIREFAAKHNLTIPKGMK